MPIRPVQLLVVSFPEPDFRGEIIDELRRLRDIDTIRLIDALAIQKDTGGNLEALQWSDLSGWSTAGDRADPVAGWRSKTARDTGILSRCGTGGCWSRRSPSTVVRPRSWLKTRSHQRRSEAVFVSKATHSTWCVIG